MPNEIVLTEEQTIIPTTEVQERVDTMLANRKYLIDKVKPLLIPNVDIYELPGMKKPSLGKPGAEKLAAIFGYVAAFEIDKETMSMIGENAGGKPYIAYICNLTRKGQLAGQGRGATFIEWERTQYKNMNVAEFEKVKDTLKPDDYKEATGQYGKYYRVKDGTTFDNLALNKAIKMAQKSAFVDAVIRATGMSDLFTQDVEDMQTETIVEPSRVQEWVDPDANTTINGAGGIGKDNPLDHSKTEEPFPDEPPKPLQEGDACPRCEKGSMKLRKGPKGQFLGCSTWPKCEHTVSV